jgi:hypothetical protein
MSIDRSSSPLRCPPRSSAPRIVASIVLPLILGLGAGMLLWALVDFTSRTDIGGPGWSLRGKGARAMPFILGPAFLATGWLMIAGLIEAGIAFQGPR